MVQKYHIDPSLIHYDITSLYFEGKYDTEDMITYGYSRDQKPDKKQINLSVNMTDKDPFPLRWEVLPGNTSDTSTVIANMEAMKKLFPAQKFVYIGDRAMMSGEIYKETLDHNYDLVAPLKDSVMTKKLLQEIEVNDLHEKVLDPKSNDVKYRLGEFTMPYNEDPNLPPLRVIVVWSKSKARANKRSREQKIQKKKRELSELKQKLNQPYYKKYSSIEKKIKKIMGKDPLNEGFSVVLTGEDGALELEVHEHEAVWDALVRQDGFYILATTLSRAEYTTLDIFNLYKRQYLVENGFETLKKEVAVRPIFVHQRERIIGLVNITLLALCIYSILKILLERQAITISVKRLFELLPLLVIFQFLLPNGILQFQVGPVAPEQLPYLKALGIEDIENWLKTQLELHYDLANPKGPD
jgi:transposase